MGALSLYEKDFYAWTQEQAKFIKEKAFDKLDVVHLFDEVESMGISEERSLESRLEILLMHLLKWKYQPGKISNSWKYTIKEQRIRIHRLLKKMPSLKGKTLEALFAAYDVARIKAANETGINEKIFPLHLEWVLEDILDDDFYPN